MPDGANYELTYRRGPDYAQALGNHASMETTEGYVKAREMNTVEPLF